MLENANAILNAAQAQFNKNASDENQIALLEAQNEILAVQAQIKGFMSEQDSNANTLKKEELELNQSLIDGDAERQKLQKDFNAEQIEGDVLRLEQQKLNAEKEKIDETKRLEDKKKLYKEGTQAFADAQNELENYTEESARNILKIEKDLAKAKQAQIKQTLGDIANIVGQSSKFGKAVAIVQAIQDTFAGANKALSQGGIFGFIGAASVIATGMRNVKQIASTKPPEPPAGLRGGGASASVSTPSIPTPTAPQTPSFDILGTSATNQIASALGQQAPVQAFVVSQDVTTSQSLQNNIIQSASLG